MTTMAQTKCGTMLWMAPEIMRNEAYNPMLADVYSMGLVLYEVFSGKLPFEHVQSDFQLLIEVAQKGVKPQIQAGVSCVERRKGGVCACAEWVRVYRVCVGMCVVSHCVCFLFHCVRSPMFSPL